MKSAERVATVLIALILIHCIIACFFTVKYKQGETNSTRERSHSRKLLVMADIGKLNRTKIAPEPSLLPTTLKRAPRSVANPSLNNFPTHY